LFLGSFFLGKLDKTMSTLTEEIFGWRIEILLAGCISISILRRIQQYVAVVAL
jgi:hypothetical protein